MGTNNICLYKEVDQNYTGCNLKTTELLDCALIGACAVIRSNMVCKIAGVVSSRTAIRFTCSVLQIKVVLINPCPAE